MAKHVLVVDDDAKICSTLQRWLSLEGFKVTALSSGVRLDEKLAREEVDLFLLDVGLPDIDGIALTRHIREKYRAGVIIVSGRGDLIDRVVGLEAGADDYVTKPFEPREVLARIRSVLRRAGESSPGESRKNKSCFAFDRWVIDMQAYSLRDREGTAVGLTSGEFALLREFVLHANKVLSRDRLMELTSGNDAAAFDRSIDVRVGRLRRKLQDGAKGARFIKTVRNGGYMFVAQPVPC
jgi:two-component system OmpR family response regulator/two-component system phosphate regulon response regulator OmpR